jgi:hypothetical protein
MRRFIRLMLLTAAFALISVALPWWSVAALALAWGWIAGGSARPADAGLAAALGWMALLGVAAVEGPLAVLAGRLGELFHAPSAVLPLVTVLFAAILGWSGAGLGASMDGLIAARPMREKR